MKKKIIFATVVAVLGVSAYVGVNAQQKDAMSDIQMANVEALGSDESGNQKNKCYKELEYVQGSKLIRECKKCSYRYGYMGNEESEC